MDQERIKALVKEKLQENKDLLEYDFFRELKEKEKELVCILNELYLLNGICADSFIAGILSERMIKHLN